MLKKVLTAMAASLVGLLLVSGCAANEGPATTPTTGEVADTATDTAPDATGAVPDAQLSGELNGAGASAQTAAQEAWKAGFSGLNPGVTVNYDPQGSGPGRQQFQEGAADFVGTDAAFKSEELAEGAFPQCSAAEIVEIPAYISPIAVVFNLDGISSLNLDPATIAGIFTGAITSWNDPAIAATNEGVDLPDATIVPVHRSDKSGTTGNFTNYLSATAEAVWTEGTVEEWPLGGGEAAEKTQGMKETVGAANGTIGYIDASQAGDLGTAAIRVGDQWVSHSAEGAALAVAASELEEGRGPGDLAFKLNRTTTEAGAYPLVLVSYLVACQTYADPAKGALTKAYFDYVISDAGQQGAAANAGSAPLQGDPGLAEKVKVAVESIN